MTTLEIRLAVALLLASLLGWHLWADHHRAQALAAAQVQHDLDVAALKPLRQANAAYAQADADRAHQAALDHAARDRQAREGQAAIASAQADAVAAQQRAQLWQDRYAARPASCSAALAALDTACPSLKDY